MKYENIEYYITVKYSIRIFSISDYVEIYICIMYLLIYIFNILNSEKNYECIDFITKYMKCIFRLFYFSRLFIEKKNVLIFKIKYILYTIVSRPDKIKKYFRFY